MKSTIKPGCAIAVLASFLAIACSTVPDLDFPPYREFAVIAHYEFDLGDERSVRLPQSDQNLVLFELVRHPGGRERFDRDGTRYWILPPGVDRATAICRGRVYGDPKSLPLAELFPAASRLEVVE